MNKLNIELIKEYCKNEDLKRVFIRQLELIQLVDKNYEHIQQLETLQMILEGGLSQYYKEYHKEYEFLTIQASIIAKNTFNNHYNREGKEHLIGVDEMYNMISVKPSAIIGYKEIACRK